MTGPSDFTDEELTWLAQAEHSFAVAPPQQVQTNLVSRGAADRTDLGLRITAFGRMILDEARSTGRIPRR